MYTEMTESVLAAVPLPLVLIGPDARVILANAPACTLLGQDPKGRHHITVLRQPAILEAIEKTLQSRQPSEARLSVAATTQETVYRVQVAPTDGGGVLVSFTDTTDLEQAGQMRRDFVANVSHELRTPLTALLGFIETLRTAARDDPAARDRFLAIMQREANRMNRLVSDLLSLSRVEANERMRPTEKIDLAANIASVVSTLRPIAAAEGVSIDIIGDAGPVMVRADPDQMTQVFSNLVENAVKYGGSGKSVTINITRLPVDPSLRQPAVRVDVIDRGAGIDAVHIPRLTERFYRVDSHRSREQGGTGLGLAIVKHIVSRHRGRFKIESQPGKGSRFSIILPDG
jgi:two-component system, OmpR family, phosphate regulon sensor histidine kinase PhoR